MVKITGSFIRTLTAKASVSPRKRTNYNFHKRYAEKVQRFLNIINLDTYIRPHKHQNPHTFEVFIILEGKAVMVTFNNEGGLKDYFVLDRAQGNYGVEIPARVWHSLIALEKNTCLYEIKQGPYFPKKDKFFPLWAPEEGTKEAELFNQNILSQKRCLQTKNPRLFGGFL